jgi:hypothetical protein
MHRDAQVARLRDELAALELGLADCRARKIPPSQSAHLLVQQVCLRQIGRVCSKDTHTKKGSN